MTFALCETENELRGMDSMTVIRPASVPDNVR